MLPYADRREEEKESSLPCPAGSYATAGHSETQGRGRETAGGEPTQRRCGNLGPLSPQERIWPLQPPWTPQAWASSKARGCPWGSLVLKALDPLGTWVWGGAGAAETMPRPAQTFLQGTHQPGEQPPGKERLRLLL